MSLAQSENVHYVPAPQHREDEPLTVAVIGAGLVGCLQACYMAKRGYTVHLYEKREDIRTMENVIGRSINLAMSVRGLSALAEVGMDEAVRLKAIPMKARMIHELDGRTWQYPYGTQGECINSVDRRKLNEVLLTEAESYPNVSVAFEYKLLSCNFDKKTLTFTHQGEEKVHSADLIIGCDGAYSVVRREMLKRTRMDFSQEYIPHGYVEICMPPKKTPSGEEFAMDVNYLHIWPRNEFMMIGLPNLDKSFTGTLFMPFDKFDMLRTRSDALNFFREMFPDSIELFGEDNLMSTFDQWKVQGLISIKCSPFHYKDRVVLMGDAAHAMVPFYGQGMNCGMEDCLVLRDSLDRFPDDLSLALNDFSKVRSEDAHAICDLAMYNYIEMRSEVNSKLFLLRRKVDTFLHWLMPNTWIPLYTTVSFTRIPYQECIENKAWQDKVVNRLFCIGLLGGIAAGGYALYKKFGDDLPFEIKILKK